MLKSFQVRRQVGSLTENTSSGEMKKLAGIHGIVKNIILPKDLHWIKLLPDGKQGEPADLC